VESFLPEALCSFGSFYFGCVLLSGCALFSSICVGRISSGVILPFSFLLMCPACWDCRVMIFSPPQEGKDSAAAVLLWRGRACFPSSYGLLTFSRWRFGTFPLSSKLTWLVLWNLWRCTVRLLPGVLSVAVPSYHPLFFEDFSMREVLCDAHSCWS